MMGRVSINMEQVPDSSVTAVSNLFIDHYMNGADEAQIKVYLYLLRMMRADRPTNLEDLADRFGLTVNGVMDALSFWERRGILSLEYDKNKQLTGIHVEDLLRDKAGALEREPQRATAPKEDGGNADGSDKWEQILFIAEQYMGRPLSPTEVKTLHFINDTLLFGETLLDYLLQYCMERGKRDFRYIERVAVRWHESGYETPEQAKRGSFKYDKRIYEVMDLLGLNNLPTQTEAAFVERWISEYRMSIELIREACSRTVLATQKNRFNYADKILLRWHEQGVTKKSDLEKLDQAHESAAHKQRESRPAPQKARNPKIHNFPERSYDFKSLESMLLTNC